jgi:hypothetical protein
VPEFNFRAAQLSDPVTVIGHFVVIGRRVFAHRVGDHLSVDLGKTCV